MQFGGMTNNFNFQKLEVYARSKKLSVELIQIATNFPYKYKRITDQLIGASISISLNLAEGSGRFNEKEKKQFYRIAKASAFETVAILEVCYELRIIRELESLEKELKEISCMISGLIKR